MSAVTGNGNISNGINSIGHKLNDIRLTNGIDTGNEAITKSVANSILNNKISNGNSNHSTANLKAQLQHHHHHQQQQQKLQQQPQQQHITNLSSKLQAPQSQHHRRSLLPSPATVAQHQHINNHHHHNHHNHQQQQQLQHQHHAAQQQSVTISAPSTTTSALTHIATTTTTTTTAHPTHQVQTVATIHHEQSQHQQQPQTAVNNLATLGSHQQQQQRPSLNHINKNTNNNNNNISNNNNVGNSNSRRSLYHLQALKNSAASTANNLKAPAHSIPPRYQPPPQPANGGILKHYNGISGSTSNGLKSSQSYFQDGVASTHFNLKYPPDIPQLSTIYIPDSIKAQGSSARFLQQRQQQQQQQHHHQQQQQSNHTQQQQDMLKFVRKPDQDHPSPNASVTSSQTGIPTSTGSSTRLTVEQNRQLQSLINELRALKDQNQRLLDDNQELRDLCCFLDDDRQKGRKLAREWQRFGRYTASVMRQEVAAYQNKLRQLDDKQQELITDNLELKELCLYLDEERAHVAANALCANCGASVRNALRDDGDGSSSSTNADETITALRNYERQLPDMHLRNAATSALTTLNDQTLQYVRSLERRIQQLEEERVTSTTPTANAIQQPTPQQPTQQQLEALADPISGRPEAVVRALQVLEVREQIERDRLGNLTGTTALDQMDDGEKALVREMCNVVWRKLESSPPGPAPLETL